MKEKDNDNLFIYENGRAVPKDAIKTIGAGKLKGYSDINPVWRIKKLTELFGPCGFGWYYTVDRQWLETSETSKEIKAFCNISLFIKYQGEWSKPIIGTGGSSYLMMTRNGPDVSDECFKMALTDALSVACKSLGIAADIYFSKDAKNGDRTKYDQASDRENASTNAASSQKPELDTAKYIQLISSAKTTAEFNNIWKGLSAELQKNPKITEAAKSVCAKIRENEKK